MDKLLIIADDFTGALDTGIQFTKMGIRTNITTDYQYDFCQLKEACSLLIVNTDSRPLSPEEAYQRVYALAVGAKAAGFQYVYKKTDSGLRGNSGMELKAVMDAYEERVAYLIPAFPKLDRITKDGIQYIEGVPVKESVFGQDPFEPVQYSDVAEIIRSQYDVDVVKVSREQLDTVKLSATDGKDEERTVMLFDAESNEDMCRIAKRLKKENSYRICAGCAGFASEYDTLLNLSKGNAGSVRKTDGLLALCGSVNAITVEQADYAKNHGFVRANLTNEQKLNPNFFQSQEGQQYLDQLYLQVRKTDKYLLETLDCVDCETVKQYASKRNLSESDVRFGIADSLGTIAVELISRGLNYTISMTGGDTLMGFMRRTNTTELVPIREIGKGAVVSEMTWKGKRLQIISKSGGFGEKDIFMQMYETIINEK